MKHTLWMILVVISLVAGPVLANAELLCDTPECSDQDNSSSKDSKHVNVLHHCCCHAQVSGVPMVSTDDFVSAFSLIGFSIRHDRAMHLYAPGPLLEPPSHV